MTTLTVPLKVVPPCLLNGTVNSASPAVVPAVTVKSQPERETEILESTEVASAQVTV